MHRSAALFFVALVAAVAALVIALRPSPPLLSSAKADGSSSGKEVVILAPSTPLLAPAPTLDSSGLDSAWAPPTAPTGTGGNADAGKTLEDGRPVPPLEAHAPKSVSFGVILVTYRGAEQAPRDARSKEDALALATKLVALAKTDFAAAVEKADWGAVDAGTLEQGVLEPGPERVLFGLAAGEVGGPVDSPRGYCIFKRAP